MVDKKIVNKVLVFSSIGVLLFAAVYILTPILIPIFLGILLAYILHPLYIPLSNSIKRPNLAAFIFIFLLILLVAIPVWFLLPLFLREVFSAYIYIQGVDLPGAVLKVASLFLSEDMARIVAVQLNSIVSNFFSYSLDALSSTFSNIANLVMKFFIVLFTFFFVTRDSEKIKKYLTELSPLSSSTEDKFAKEFRNITNSIVFGQIATGLIQGLALGLALWILGVPKVLFLTLIGVITSIIPIVGAWLVWIPVSLFLIVSGQTLEGTILFLYGLLFVSSLDNIIRPLFISKGSNLNIFIAIIGTIGGLYTFGVIGLILGPLILSYFLIVVEFYKQGKLNELFKE